MGYPDTSSSHGASLFWLKNIETFQQVGVIAYDINGAIASAARKSLVTPVDLQRWRVENVTPIKEGYIIERTEAPRW